MKRKVVRGLKLAGVASACALSLSASISGAAGGDHPFDAGNGWYGRAGGLVAPASLTGRSGHGSEIRVTDLSTVAIPYGRAGGPVGVAQILAVKASRAPVIAFNAGCERFGRAGGPVGIDAVNCGSGAEEATVAQASVR
jgi:hypothetical protein